ncbi:MAG TPA: hypothetical protein VFH59_07790 [Frateuria sp.]|uniref:hypothetical protein n=1 Tax=Frateuria sp. TaxID=2211372 RepID=UPI002D7EA433|nr:hypothetical protein [Frateuria sp.]HET6805323.1 hypothetical protein [Frateuria sp.]
MSEQAKSYTVHFPKDARPGVLAIGGIKRGGSAKVDAAEAVRLVDAKGMSFASAADEKAARGEVATAKAKAEAEARAKAEADAKTPEAPATAPTPTDTLSEEH